MTSVAETWVEQLLILKLLEKYKYDDKQMQRKYNTMIYVVRRNAYVHGQRLEDNFTNNETLQKLEKLTKSTTPIHPNGTSLEHSSESSLKFSQRTHLQLLSTSLKLGCVTNEQWPFYL